MPSLVHSCGKKLTFPDGMEGKKGKCPQCGGLVEVPGAGSTSGPQRALGSSGARGGLAPSSGSRPALNVPAGPALSGLSGQKPRGQWKVQLDPPKHWEQYQAFLEGRGPNPRPVVMPHKLMLKTDADEKWEAEKQKAPPSKFTCPGCKDRLSVGALVCTKCGLDLKKGKTLDGKTKLNEAGLEYLKKIPWLQAQPEEFSPDAEDD